MTNRDSTVGPRGIATPAFDGSPRKRGTKGKEVAGFVTPASKSLHRSSSRTAFTDGYAAQKRDAGFPGLFNAFEADAKLAQRRPKVPKVAHADSPPRSQHNADPPHEAPSSPIRIDGPEIAHDDLATSSPWRADLHASHPVPTDERAEVSLDAVRTDRLVPAPPFQLLVFFVR